ncbi:hypothetical protein P170DRAFT_477416 [Aspergillus steynii IBT 23096]|uniref:Uncharacterized protein n=1 Tax=Aspergillus steynii IBT 23096 TaxID=1392250 RepID=A0A2I2G0W9_9EURO|nr:uncharacterized protein P170DRAFT_477416 [Aspergillus steynii IBT 23096]PLB46535.1 hypothetical protein P170DRAFT_477416 [Aspergillus steynii IBT 23096]
MSNSAIFKNPGGISRRKKNPEESPKSKSIDEIWAEAMDQIAKEYKLSSEKLEQFNGNLYDGETGSERARALFEESRHPDDRKDKVMSSVAGCLDWVKTGLGFVNDNVSGTYAVPAKIVTGSIAYMIQAAEDVSADFDLIESTFETLNNALQDIGELQRFKLEFASPTFLERLTDIFVAMVKFCSMSGTVFSSTRRKRWFRALLKGQDQQIREACNEVKKAIGLFRDTLPFQTLVEMNTISTNMKDMPVRFVEQLQASVKYSELQPLWNKSQKSLDAIKDSLKAFNLFHPEVEQWVEDQMKLVAKRVVNDTFSWTESESTYTEWESGRGAPYIFILGEAGSGKTFFACHCYKSLQKRKALATKDQSSQRRTIPFVTYFPFKGGRESSQGLGSVLAHILLQVAMQDMKLRDSIARDLLSFKERKKEGNDDSQKVIEFIWQSLLVRKFEKAASEAPRELFILLDGVEVMCESDRTRMMDLFQHLSLGKDRIRILMTGAGDKTSVGIPRCPVIVLNDMIGKKGDIWRIIQHRVSQSEKLRNFKDEFWKQVEKRLLESLNTISTVDIKMTVIEQANDEVSALEKLKTMKTPEGLYKETISVVLSSKSENQRKLLRFVFALCTFAQQPLSVYVLQEFVRQEPDLRKSALDVAEQIKAHSSNSFLFVTEVSEGVDLSEDKQEDAATRSKRQIATFRQVAFREYLETTTNDLIPHPLKSKVSLFVKLTDVLCGHDSEGAGLRENIQRYAAQRITRHLETIDVKLTEPAECSQVIKALSRIFNNDGNVSRVFEELCGHDISYDYDGLMSTIYDAKNLGIVTSWAKKMDFHEETEIPLAERSWIKRILKEPTRLLENLAKGHFYSWTEARTYPEAKVPHNLICRALHLRFGKNRESVYSTTVDAAQIKALLNYAKKRVFYDLPVQMSRCRIAAALVLYNESTDEENREFARNLYQQNIDDEVTRGPERFYSYLGLAEYFEDSREQSEKTGDNEQDRRWTSVSEFAERALHVMLEESGTLGTDLNEGRITRAFVLHSYALKQLGKDTEAIETGERCLKRELQYTSQTLDLLSLLVDIYAKNSQWAKIIDLVWRQKPVIQDRFIMHIYLMERLENGTTLLERAAAESRRIDYLIRIFERAIDFDRKTFPIKAAFLKSKLLNIYWRLAKVTKMAEYLMEEILTATSCADFIVFDAFSTMVEVYYENFTFAHLDESKKEALDNLESLIGRYEHSSWPKTSFLSMAKLTLAKMYLKSGNNEQADKHVQSAFEICIADLEDSISYNDLSAFRALTKALAFLGLEEDAKVAFSLQLSRVGANDDGISVYEESGLPSSNSSISSDSLVELEENHEKERPSNTALVNSKTEGKPRDEPPSPVSPLSSTHEPESAPTPLQPEDSTATIPTNMDSIEGSASCDGVCQPTVSLDVFEPHGSKIVYCLDCMNTDFCKDCYMKQINFFEKGEDGFWFKACWTRHEYLLGPIDGWIGVKDGVIHIGEKKCLWDDWLSQVKGRWRKKISSPTVWDDVRSREPKPISF